MNNIFELATCKTFKDRSHLLIMVTAESEYVAITHSCTEQLP